MKMYFTKKVMENKICMKKIEKFFKVVALIQNTCLKWKKNELYMLTSGSIEYY